MLSMIAVVVGAALGSAATAGLLGMGGTPATPAAKQSDPMTFTAALERIDHETHQSEGEHRRLGQAVERPGHQDHRPPRSR